MIERIEKKLEKIVDLLFKGVKEEFKALPGKFTPKFYSQLRVNTPSYAILRVIAHRF